MHCIRLVYSWMNSENIHALVNLWVVFMCIHALFELWAATYTVENVEVVLAKILQLG